MNIDNVSSISYDASTVSCRKKRFVEIIILASKSHKYNHLGRRTVNAIELEIDSD